MSFANPGKRGILTVIALMLIVGVPGVIAYADNSDDTYYNYTDVDLSEISKLILDSEQITDPVTVEDDGIYTLSFTSSESTSQIKLYYDAVLEDVAAFRVTLDFGDLDISSVLMHVRTGSAYSSNVYYHDLEYDGTGTYEFELSAAEQLAANVGSCYVMIEITTTEELAAGSYEISHAVAVASSESIFTDDVVELIVMVGGIALLICGTFALSFIDVDTPGKAVSYAKRGIRSAGNKMRRGKR